MVKQDEALKASAIAQRVVREKGKKIFFACCDGVCPPLAVACVADEVAIVSAISVGGYLSFDFYRCAVQRAGAGLHAYLRRAGGCCQQDVSEEYERFVNHGAAFNAISVRDQNQ